VGFVLVLEDLTELLRGQKAAAWREVAQRIAHEIKNPLTPIQLSTERIRRLLERSGSNPPKPEVFAAIEESALLISQELTALKTLVDEFSAFARFPLSQPVPFSVNAIVENALDVFNGRLDGIHVHCGLCSDLPSVQADPEQLKRAVVNLIDNAAEALESSPAKEVWVSTDLDSEREIVEIIVADSGPGIPAEDKEKLFLPFFSTKQRGTGLGLAIVSRIISEHNGLVRVEENRPSGAKFIIELPVTSNSEL
jgi:nitrogen fixation/metabolism regulation signal transduction histidine kinase